MAPSAYVRLKSWICRLRPKKLKNINENKCFEAVFNSMRKPVFPAAGVAHDLLCDNQCLNSVVASAFASACHNRANSKKEFVSK